MDRRVRRKLSTSKGSGGCCCEIGLFAKRPRVFKRIEPRYTRDIAKARPLGPKTAFCPCIRHGAAPGVRRLSVYLCCTFGHRAQSKQPGATRKSESWSPQAWQQPDSIAFCFFAKQTTSVKHRCAPITMSITEVPSSLFLARGIKRKKCG